MSDATKRPLPRGIFEYAPGLYGIQYFEHGRRHRHRIGPRLSRAIDAYQTVRTRIREGRFLPPPTRLVRFEELAADAAEHIRRYKKPISQAYDCARLEKLKGWFAKLSVEHITPELIEKQLEKLEREGRSGGTLNGYRSLLSLVFRVALRNRKVKHNPVSEVPRRRPNQGRLRFLSVPEERLLRARIRELYAHREPEFDLALHTGMRQGEQYQKRFSRGLHWKDVNWQQGLLSLYETKNDQPRHIPINSAARAALRRLRSLRTGELVCAFWDEDRKDRSSAAKGHQVAPKVLQICRTFNARRRWFEACTEAAAFSDVTWHTLRHTFISRLVMAGVDLRTVQVLAGHKDIHTTMRYAHLAPGHQRQAVARLVRYTPVKAHRQKSATRAAIARRVLIQSRVKSNEMFGAEGGS